MSLLSRFESSPWLRLLRGVLLASALWAVAEDTQAEAQKAAGQPVTALDVPGNLVALVGFLVGILRGGEPNRS